MTLDESLWILASEGLHLIQRQLIIILLKLGQKQFSCSSVLHIKAMENEMRINCGDKVKLGGGSGRLEDRE